MEEHKDLPGFLTQLATRADAESMVAFEPGPLTVARIQVWEHRAPQDHCITLLQYFEVALQILNFKQNPMAALLRFFKKRV